jgi:hypothetical protein
MKANAQWWQRGSPNLKKVGHQKLRQLMAEVLVDPKAETRGNQKKASLVTPGDTREWRKKPHQRRQRVPGKYLQAGETPFSSYQLPIPSPPLSRCAGAALMEFNLGIHSRSARVRSAPRPTRFLSGHCEADWNADKFRFTREQLPPVEYLTRPYFDHWYRTYAAMLLGSGLVTAEELATGRSTQSLPTFPKPMSAADVATRLHGRKPAS